MAQHHSDAHNLLITTKATSRTRRRAHGRAVVPEPDARTDVRLGRVVRLLADNPMIVISGTKLAGEIGTGRSEVWRLVQQLRGLGVDIAGHPATGYQLREIPDLLLPESVAPLVQGSRFGERIHHFFRVGSTNAVAMEAAAAGEPEGAVFLAEEQSAGRGRGGHTWHSARSHGIYCSVVLRPAIAPADALVLSLATGLAVAAAVEQVTGIKPDLRWPNDLLIGERKVCGILIEMNAETTRVRYAVVGIGLNVNQPDFPSELREVATSLSTESGRSWSRVELTGALLQSLDREYANVIAGETQRQAMLRRFELASSFARGKLVQVDENGGFMGMTDGLDPRGFLRVLTTSGARTVLSGSVRPVSD